MSTKAPFNWEQMLSYYWWKLLFFKATGGRPMIYQSYNSIDVVSGKPMWNYTDRFGRKWMAGGGRWSLSRVRRSGD